MNSINIVNSVNSVSSVCISLTVFSYLCLPGSPCCCLGMRKPTLQLCHCTGVTARTITIRNVCLLLLGIKKTHPFQRASRSITVNCVIRAAPMIIANSWHAAPAELSCVSIRSWKWYCCVQYYGVALCWDFFCEYSLIKVVLLHPILWCCVVLGLLMKTLLLRPVLCSCTMDGATLIVQISNDRCQSLAQGWKRSCQNPTIKHIN